MTLPGVRIENKSTVKDSYRIKLDDLLKINQEALEKAEVPALALQFVSPNGQPRPQGKWVLIPEYVWQEIESAIRSDRD